MAMRLEYRIEVNLASGGAIPVWHYLMEDDNRPCTFLTEDEAGAAMIEDGRGINARLVVVANSTVVVSGEADDPHD